MDEKANIDVPDSSRNHPGGANAPFDPETTIPNMRIRRERGELLVGDVALNRYELLEKLGSGAMGVVFKCRDQVSQVEYALKMVPPELVRDANAMEDVRENFQLVHSLKHPNIASVDFLDRDEYGSYFLIMEYVPGITLQQWIRQKWRMGQPEPGEVAGIVKQIASALDYAHQKRILHRDIKPTNIVVTESGEVKVLDFGLASKVRNTLTAMSINPANTSGTPGYLAPEQFKGRYPTPAADQYALGVLAYQMLSGHLPFDSDDYNVLRSAVVSEIPEEIDGLPREVNRSLLKILNKDPKARYTSCSEFAAALANERQDASRVEQPQTGEKNNSTFSSENAFQDEKIEQKTRLDGIDVQYVNYSTRSLYKISLYQKWLIIFSIFTNLVLLVYLIFSMVDPKYVEFASIMFFSPFFLCSFAMLALLRDAEKKDDFGLTTILTTLALSPLIIGLINLATWNSRSMRYSFSRGFSTDKILMFIFWYLSCIFGMVIPLYEIGFSTKILKRASIRVKVFGTPWTRIKELKKQSATMPRTGNEGTSINTKGLIITFIVVYLVALSSILIAVG